MLRDINFASWIHPAAQSDIGKQQWVTGIHCVRSVAGLLIAPRWQSISIQANIVRPSVNKSNLRDTPRDTHGAIADYDDTN